MKSAIEVFAGIQNIKTTTLRGEVLKFHDDQHWFVTGAMMVRHRGIKWPADIPLRDCPKNFPFDMGNVGTKWDHFYVEANTKGVEFNLEDVMWKNKNAVLGDVHIAGWIMRAIFALPRPKLAPFTCMVTPTEVYVQAGGLWEAILMPLRMNP